VHFQRLAQFAARRVRQSVLTNRQKTSMGTAHEHPPVLLFMAAFSRHEQALDWARQRSCAQWGELVLASDVMAFDYTTYYQPTMGTGLRKVLLAYRQLIDPARLPEIKHQTNAWETEYRQQVDWTESRPLNLDPGYLTEAKLVLATTKDRNHRIYLGQGIFAEVTLHYQRGPGWAAHEWTYADYRSPAYHTFLDQCRAFLRSCNHVA
jgi:hypothetical protein